MDPITATFQRSNHVIAIDLYKSLQDTAIQPPQEILSMQYDQIFKLVKYIIANQDWHRQPDTIVNLITYAILPTSRPTPDFSSICEAAGNGGQRGVCGKVWQEDGIGYKCKTCERDPTCVVCVPCFRKGDHTGHDYFISKTRFGCCDCGDAQAWDPKGFCSMHKGASHEDDNPDLLIPQQLRERLLAAVEAVVSEVLASVVMAYCYMRKWTNHVPGRSLVACELLEWLTNLARCGDGFSRAIGHIFTNDTKRPWVTELRNQMCTVADTSDKNFCSEPRSCLELLLRLDGKSELPTKLQSSLHQAYFQLITDISFKRYFMEGFIDNYARYVYKKVSKHHSEESQRRNHDEFDDIIGKFSVQLFTVPALVPAMIREGGLLDVLLDVILNLLEVSSAPVSIYKTAVALRESKFMSQNSKFASPSFIDATLSENNSKSNLTSDQCSTLKRTSLPILLKREDSPLVFPTWSTRSNNLRNTGSPTNSSETERQNDKNEHQNTANEANTTQQESPVSHPQPAGSAQQPNQTNSQSGDPIEPARAIRLFTFGDIMNSGVVLPVLDNNTTDNSTLTDEGPDEDENQDDDDMEQAPSDFESGSNNGSDEDEDQPQNATFEVTEMRIGLDNFPDREEFTNFLNILINDDAITREITMVATEDRPTETNFPEQPIRSARDPSNSEKQLWTDQLEMLEEGMNLREKNSCQRDSMFHKSIRQARSMAKDAINGSGPLAHPLRIDFFRKHDLDTYCVNVIRDISFVLTHDMAAFSVVHLRKDLFRKIIRVFSMAQGMNPRSRKFGNHVPMDLGTSQRRFKLEVELTMIAIPLIAAFISDSTKLQNKSVSTSDMLTNISLSESRKEAIRIIHSCLEDWLGREEILEALTTKSNEQFSVSHSVSIHLPLHRFLAIFIHHAVRLDNTSIQELLSDGEADCIKRAKRLLLHPLRIQAYLAQVRAGMWVKNGRFVTDQSTCYNYQVWSQWFIDMDLFLQQCCAVVLEPKVFITEALREFRIRDLKTVLEFSQQEFKSEMLPEKEIKKVNPNEKTTPRNDDRCVGAEEMMDIDMSDAAMQTGLLPCAPSSLLMLNTPILKESDIKEMGNSPKDLCRFVPTLLDEFFLFLVRIVSERTRCGETKDHYLRKRVLHQLAVEDKRHSELYGTFSNFPFIDLFGDSPVPSHDIEDDNSEIDDILGKIADYIQPKGMTQGTYKLRNQFWSEFDHFTPLLSPPERNAAEIRYAAVCKQEGKKTHVIPAISMRERETFDQFRGLKTLASNLCNAERHGVVSIYLHELSHTSNGSLKIEGSLSASLHLACIAVELNEQLQNDVEKGLNQFKHDDQSHGSAIWAICKIHDKCLNSKEGLMFKEISSALERILEETYKRGNTNLREFVLHNSSHVQRIKGVTTKSDIEGSGRSDPEEERKQRLQRLKKERQAAALATMQKAQAQFANHITSFDLEPEGESATAMKRESQNNHNVVESSDAGNESNEMKTDDEPLDLILQSKENSNDVCALCHTGVHHSSKKHLGLVGFYQVSNLISIANDRCRQARIEDQKQNGSKKSSLERRNLPQQYLHRNVDGNLEIGEASIEREFTMRDERFCHTDYWEMASSSPLLRTRVLETSQGKVSSHLSLCGHFIHLECLERFLATRRGPGSNVFDEEEGGTRRKHKVFLCPVCRRLANVVLPIAQQRPHEQPTQHKLTRSLPFRDWKKFYTNELKTELKDIDMEDNQGTDDIFPENTIITDIESIPDDIIIKDLRAKDEQGKFGLDLFGFLTLRELRSLNHTQTNEGSGNLSNSFPVLPYAIISTLSCIEICSRSIAWNDESFQRTRHNLAYAFREVRSHLKLRNSLREESLRELWTHIVSRGLSIITDPFAVLCLLTMLWSDPFDILDAKRLVHFCLELVPHPLGQKIRNDITPAHLRFIRQATVMMSILFESISENPVQAYGLTDKRGEAEIKNEFSQLLGHFSLSESIKSSPLLTPDTLIMDPVYSPVFNFWPTRIGLIRLPNMYQSLLHTLDGKPCSRCNETSPPIVCLVCGALICAKRNASSPPPPMWHHARECGAGIGVFLQVKNTVVEVVRRENCTVWGSPYLDMHGEEDRDLDRGKPLFLCQNRYLILERLWLLHAFDQDSQILGLWRINM